MRNIMMGNNIRSILTSQKITQTELANKVGVKREYISRIINGEITPAIPLGIKIAKAWGKRVEDVFFIAEYTTTHIFTMKISNRKAPKSMTP